MTENEERAYMQGQRSVLVKQLNDTIAALGYGDDSVEGRVAGLVAEREAALAALRTACRDHGDNDWPDYLHMADIIEKHLMRHLDQG